MRLYVLAFIISFLLPSWVEAGQFDGILISGNKEFKKQITSALSLLKQKSPSTYLYVKKHIGKIEQSEKSGMNVYATLPTYEISDVTTFHSLSWCAGTIVHDAYHSYLYSSYIARKGGDVPYSTWAGTEAELKAIEMQKVAMRDIQAPKYQIDYLDTLDGTHGDVNNDGKLTQDDYEKRSW